MVWELGIGKAIVGAIARKVVEAGISGVSLQLSKSEVEKALEVALNEAQAKAELVPSLNTDDSDWVEGFLQTFLGGGIGLEELQKGSEKPDAGVLAIAFEQVAQTTPRMKSVEPDQLELWLRIFIETYFEQTNTFIRYRAKLREYRDRLITSCEDVKFVGIDVSAREDHRAARLLDIFVVPNVSEESTKSAFSPDRLLLERPEQLTERQAELWLEQRDRHAQERGRSMSAHEMLRATTRQRVVLLGDPGTGKTTLMRYLAVMAAGVKGAEIGLPEGVERLPILVYMRDWAKHPERSLLDQVRDFAENTLQMELPTGFLEHWTEGQALLLLDGLDEVAEDATRAALVEKINCFLAAHGNNWAVITSRPWGYRRDYFRTDAYPHFELKLFDEAQIQEFIEHWYENRCDNAVEAQNLVRDLQDALKSKDRLQDLVKNPLLLTMVALIHRYQDVLPKRRYKLYDRAVDTLLKSWDRKGKGETYGEFKHLDRDDDLRRVMSQLAYWIHTQYETQSTESGTIIEEADLLNQLSQIIRQEYPLVKAHQAKEEAERFVTFIRGRTGLLNEYGRGRYAFVHKTFQEYLTAEAILNKAEYEDNSELIYEAVQIYLHNSHWREVILLLVGQLQGKKAAKAIEVILQRNSPYEKWLNRDLLFAGHCLTEDPEKLTTAASETVSGILKRLINLEIEDNGRICEPIKKETFEILVWLKETSFNSEALNHLKASKSQIGRWRFMELQLKLGEKQIVVERLLKLLKDEDLIERYRAAALLGKLGNRSEMVLKGLLDLLKDKNPFIRSKTVHALVSLGDRSEIILNGLFELFENEYPEIRFEAATALGSLGNRSEIVLNRLLELLKDEEASVRLSAAGALETLGERSEIVLNGLLELLEDKDSFVRSKTAEILLNLGNRSEILNKLLDLLKDENSDIRSSAVVALGRSGDRSEIVLNRLFDLLKDKNASVRFSAAEALVNLGGCSEIIVNELFKFFNNKNSFLCSNNPFDWLNDKNSELRSRAAKALVNLGYHSEILANELIDLLKSGNMIRRLEVVETLGKLGNRSDIVLKVLLSLLKDENSLVGSSAASALGKLGKSDPKIQSTLSQWIEQHSDLPNLGSAIDALWQTCA
jgi:predicted NACHT family NTPase